MKRNYHLKQRTKFIFGIGGVILSLLAVIVPISLNNLKISAQSTTTTGTVGTTASTEAVGDVVGSSKITKSSDGNLQFEVTIPKSDVTGIKEGSEDYFKPSLANSSDVTVRMANTPDLAGDYVATFSLTPEQAAKLTDVSKLRLQVDTISGETTKSTQNFALNVTGAEVKELMTSMKAGDEAKKIDVSKPAETETATSASADMFEKCKENFGDIKWIGSLVCSVSKWIGDLITKVLTSVFTVDTIIGIHKEKLINVLSWAYPLWKAMIRIADIVAIIGLIVIAFANILHINLNVYAVKKILPALIFALIFANLSWFIGSALYAFANALVDPIASTSVKTVIGEMSGTMGEALAINLLIVWFQPLIAIFIGVILIALFVVYLVLGILLTVQPVIVALFLAVAPAAIVCMPFSQTATVFQRWLKMTLNWIFMWTATVLIFWMLSFIIKTTGETSMGNILVVIKELLVASVSGETTLGEAISSSFVKLLPLLIAVAGMAFAIRMPFTLGKDALALIEAGKNGIGQMKKLGQSTAATAGTVYQAGKRSRDALGRTMEGSVKRNIQANYKKAKEAEPELTMKDFLERQNRRPMGWVEQGMNVLGGGYRNRARQSALVEDWEDQKAQAVSEAKAAAEHEWYVEHRDGDFETPLDSRDSNRLHQHVIAAAADKEREYDYDALLKSKFEDEARRSGRTVDQVKADAEASAAVREAALGGWAGTDRGYTPGDIKGKKPTLMRQIWQGAIETGENDSEAKKTGKRLLNNILKQLQLDRQLAKFEFGLDWPAKQAEFLKGLRQETFFGTRTFERLAGPDLASKQVITEYTAKYQGWQFQDLLDEVRKLGHNLSPEQIGEITRLSGRKAYPAAQRMGYTGSLDDLAKLYNAAREMQSAGRRRSAGFTLENMIREGRPGRDRNIESGGALTGSGTANRPMQVEVTPRSGKKLSERLGGEISRELADALDSLGDDIAAMPAPQLQTRIQQVMNSDMTVDAKINEILHASSQITPTRSDLSTPRQDATAAAKAYQLFVHERSGQPITLDQAQKDLARKAFPPLRSQAGQGQPPSPSLPTPPVNPPRNIPPVS